MSRKKGWAHLHLPRLRAGDTGNVISLKVPGETIRYVSAVSLRGAEFKVSLAGRRRAIEENVRNVHAWVVGDIGWESRDIRYAIAELRDVRQAVYDPWKGSTFVDLETLEPVHHAERVLMIGKNVYYEQGV